jgi:hypothetical protein
MNKEVVLLRGLTAGPLPQQIAYQMTDGTVLSSYGLSFVLNPRVVFLCRSLTGAFGFPSTSYHIVL